jgi:dihydroorotate dehydrogenase (NAD+) catalytic subunit
MINLGINIAGVMLENPVITASGTYGFGREYSSFYDISQLGAICVKGLTLKERLGNPPPRIAETPAGVLNSVGLQNPGVDWFIREELPLLKDKGCVVIANIAGNTIEEYIRMAEKISESDTDLIELNISCPNVKEGGVAFGVNCDSVYQITSVVKQNCRQPLIVKLSPNVTDIAAIAQSAEQGGADALSLINTILGMRIDINSRKPILANNVGGLSGPAVKPIAVRMVWQVRNATKLPIIGMGGISDWRDAIEFMLAGASAVAIGTALFNNPYAPLEILDGLMKYLENRNIDDINQIISKVIPN